MKRLTEWAGWRLGEILLLLGLVAALGALLSWKEEIRIHGAIERCGKDCR